MRLLSRSALPLVVCALAAAVLPAVAAAQTPALPPVQIVVSPWQTEALTPATFTAQSTDPAVLAPGTFTWEFGDGSGPVVGDATGAAVHTFATSGRYLVTLTITNPDGSYRTGITDFVGVAAAKNVVASVQPPVNASVLGLLLHQRTLALNCAGVEAGTVMGQPIRSCAITARVDPATQGRLGLTTDVVAAGEGFTSGPGQLASVKLVFTEAARDAFVALKQDVTVKLEATVVGFNNGVTSVPRTSDIMLSGKAGYNDCPPIRAGVVCFPWMGKQAGAGIPGAVTGVGWPAITGLRWEITANDNAGEKLPGTYLNDALLGRHGSDVLTGDAGDDVLWGDAVKTASPAGQRDRLTGGAGNDWLYASRGTNTISAGDGNDQVLAVDGKGTIDCGPGKDTVTLKKQKPLKQTKRQKKAHKKPKLTPDAYRLKSCEKVTRR